MIEINKNIDLEKIGMFNVQKMKRLFFQSMFVLNSLAKNTWQLIAKLNAFYKKKPTNLASYIPSVTTIYRLLHKLT